jgi:hypothetical protein
VNWTASNILVTKGEILYVVADPGHRGTDAGSGHDYPGGADNLVLQVNMNFIPSPEPGSIVMLATGGIGLGLMAWKRRRKA